MEGTMSEIRLFAGNFAPRMWQTCSGQILAISSNNALFALLGTTFGGNGVQTFGLPDMQGRTAVGSGVSPVSGVNYLLGQKAGANTVTLLSNNLPAHNHPTTATSPTLQIRVSAANATVTTPVAGSSIGAANVPGRTPTPASGFNAATPDTALNAGSLAFTPTAYGGAGASAPHNNMQPYLGLNYIICIQGIFPSRN